MKTEKKKVTITLTAKEAQWLWNQLETLRRSAPASELSFQAKSLQDRLESES